MLTIYLQETGFTMHSAHGGNMIIAVHFVDLHNFLYKRGIVVFSSFHHHQLILIARIIFHRLLIPVNKASMTYYVTVLLTISRLADPSNPRLR